MKYFIVTGKAGSGKSSIAARLIEISKGVPKANVKQDGKKILTKFNLRKDFLAEYCDGYALGYKTMWNSLAGETTSSQRQSQVQAQGGSNVRIDGYHNNVVIAARQTQEQAASSSSDSNSGEYGK